jgi:hypothetical protein
MENRRKVKMEYDEKAQISVQEDNETEGLPTYSEDGIDLTLIRWMLSLSPAQRLDTLQQFVDTFIRRDHAGIRS